MWQILNQTSEGLDLKVGFTHSVISLEYFLSDSSSPSSSLGWLWRSISLSLCFHISVSTSSFCCPRGQKAIIFLVQEKRRKQVISETKKIIQIIQQKDWCHIGTQRLRLFSPTGCSMFLSALRIHFCALLSLVLTRGNYSSASVSSKSRTAAIWWLTVCSNTQDQLPREAGGWCQEWWALSTHLGN